MRGGLVIDRAGHRRMAEFNQDANAAMHERIDYLKHAVRRYRTVGADDTLLLDILYRFRRETIWWRP